MSWGWKIAILYTGFVLFVLFMIFRAARQDFHLVAEDYYKQEIAYQQVIEGIRNAQNLGDKFTVKYNVQMQTLLLQFPADQKGKIKGDVYFFRPSDSNLDIKIAVRTTDEGIMEIPTNNLKKGLWKLKVLWTFDGNNYYFEKDQIL